MLRRAWSVLRDAVQRLGQDDASLLAGAMSFFAFLSLVPMLLVAILTIGWVLGRERALAEVVAVGDAALGPEGASALEVLLGNPSIGQGSAWVAIASLVTALYGGSRAFVHLQTALNRTFEVRRKAGEGWRERARIVVVKRGVSVLIVLGVAIAVLLSVIAKTVLTVVAGVATSLVGDVPHLFTLLELFASTGILALFLGVVYTVLPDVEVEHTDVAAGAISAAVLLSLGAKLLSLYLVTVAARSLSGAAATFIVTLLWLYYTSYVVLFGAEITAALACLRGHPIRPEPHAEWLGGEHARSATHAA
jgi:membrane protein